MNKVLRYSTLVLVPTTVIVTALGLIREKDNLEERLNRFRWNNSTKPYDSDTTLVQNDLTPAYNSEQLFVSSNPRLNQDFKSEHAYVIVHPGFLRVRTPNYTENIPQLIRNLKNSGELTIFFEEEMPNGYSKKEFPVFDSAFVIVTMDGGVAFKKYVKTNDELEEQRADLVYSFLRNNGVKEIRLAGELAWSEYNERWYDNPLACLGIIAENFHRAGFDIKGIESCIYPTEPRTDNKILMELYNDSVNPLQLTSHSH